MQELLAFSFVVMSAKPADTFRAIEQEVVDWAWLRTGQPTPDITASDGAVSTAEGHELRWSRADTGDASRRALEIEFVHEDEGDSGLSWHSTVELALDQHGLRVCLRIAREATRLVMRPASVTLGTPRLVPALLGKFDCRAGDLRLAKEGLAVDPAGIDSLVETICTPPPNRSLPVVVVAPRDGSPSAERIASRLAGLAHVYGLQGFRAYQQLITALPDAFTPPGGVRVYWPGFGSPSDGLRHPYWTAAQLAVGHLPIEDLLFGILSRVSVLRVPRDPLLRKLRAEARSQRREAIASAGGDVAEYQALLDDVEQELSRLEEENRVLEDTVANLESALANARANLETVWVADDQAAGDSAQDAAGVEPPPTWLEFAERLPELQTASTGALTFTERAAESARSTGYPDPQRMWRTLEALAEAAREYRKVHAAVGARLDVWFMEGFGLDYAAQDSKLGELADFEFEGVAWSREPHIKVDDAKHGLDNTGRIYFAVDKEGLRFIVDHIGRKLTAR